MASSPVKYIVSAHTAGTKNCLTCNNLIDALIAAVTAEAHAQPRHEQE